MLPPRHDMEKLEDDMLDQVCTASLLLAIEVVQRSLSHTPPPSLASAATGKAERLLCYVSSTLCRCMRA